MATRLFAAYGYHAVSMRDLARELEMQAPSIYSFVGSKRELLRQCVESYVGAINELAVELAGEVPGDISALVLGLFKVYESHTEAMTIIHRDLACVDDAAALDDSVARLLVRYGVSRELAYPALAALRDPFMRFSPASERTLKALHRMLLRIPDLAEEV